VDLGALREAVAQSAVVETACGVVTKEDDAAAHARADPATGVAEHDGAATGHVLECEATQVAAEQHVGPGKADAGPRVGAPLHVEAAALRAVAEALPHRAVDPVAARVPRLENSERPAERGLRGAVLRATGDAERHAIGRVRAEAVARDRTMPERGGELGDHRARDALTRELPGRRGRDEAMLATKARVIRRTARAFGTIARFLLNGRSTGHGEDAQLAAAATHRTRGREQRGEIDAIEAAHLREEIGAADQILRRRHAETGDDPRELLSKRAEEAHEIRDRALELLRLESLEALLDRLGRRSDLRCDADVTGVELTATADRAADRDHRHRPEPDAVRAKAEHLRDIERALHPAVAPDLHVIAQAVGDERAVRLGHADLRRQACTPQRVLPRRAGPAVISGQRDDVGARFCDATRDDPDIRCHRDLHGDTRARVDGLQLVDDLREILDRVDVVIVRRRDEVDAGPRVARERDLDRHLLRREVTALARLRALADLDLEVVGRIGQHGRDTEPSRRDLLAAVAWVLADQVRQLAALAVDAEQIHPSHRLGVRAVRGLPLRAEGHRRDVDRRLVVSGAGARGRARFLVERRAEVEEMPQRYRMRSLELLELFGEHAVRLLAVRDRQPGLPYARVDTEHRLDARGSPLAQHRPAIEAVGADALPRQAVLVTRAERRDAEHPRDLWRDADRGELPAVSADLVHAERRDDLLHSLAERLDEIRQRVGIAERERVLEEQVGVHRIGAERERDHQVVEVAQAARRYDERAFASQRAIARRLGDERAMRGGHDQQRIEPSATFFDDVSVLNDHERRPAA